MYKPALQAKKFAALKPFRLPFHPPFRRGMRSLIEQEPNSLAQQALSILRSFGTDAHVFLPGSSGVSLSGLLTNNYTESTGATGYSANDGVAGLVLDGMGSVGSELVTNGTFEDATGWTLGTGWSVSDGALNHTSGVYEYATTLTGAAFTTGSTYRVRFTQISGGGIGVFVKGGTAPAPSGAGEKEVFVVAASSGTGLRFGMSSANCVIDNVSCVEVTGIHDTQSTTANKPAVRRGAYNLLTWSQDFTNAGWTTSAVTKTSTSAQDALGGSTACLVTLTSAAGAHQLVSPTLAQTSGTTYTQSVYVKPGTATRCQVTCGSVSFGTTCYANFSLVGSGSVLASGAGVTAKIQLGQNGFYRVSITLAATASASSPAVAVAFIDSDTATRSPSFTGNGTDTLTVCFAQSETGSTAGDYTPTTSAAASNPNAGRYWWSFDGSNDSLALGSVPFQMSDDHCVIAGARADVATASCVFGIAGAGGQRIAVLYSNAGTLVARWTDDAATNSAPTVGSGVTTGVPFVATARKVGSAKYARLNGVSTAAENTAVGTTTATTAYIGFWTGVYHTGAIGPVVIIKGTISDSELLTLERWVASLTPNFTATF